MSVVEIERVDGTPIARVKADVDAANAAAVHELLAEGLNPDSECLIVDLTETRYLDSAGLDMLLRLAERLSHRRASLTVVIPEGSQLNRLVAIVGLPQVIPVHTTVSAALESCAKQPPASSGAATVAEQEESASH